MRGAANRRSHENCEDDRERKRHNDAMSLPHIFNPFIPFPAQFLCSWHCLNKVCKRHKPFFWWAYGATSNDCVSSARACPKNSMNVLEIEQIIGPLTRDA